MSDVSRPFRPARRNGDVTIGSYDAAAERYLAASARPGPAVIAYLDRFAALVGPGTVLEIGSGPGFDAEHLESRGVRVVRSDATPAFVARLRAAGHDVRRIDVRSDDLGGPYDGVLADAVLHHVDRSDLPSVLARLRKAVGADGVLGLTLKEGDGAAWSEAKLGVPRHFTYWREPGLRDALEGSGWQVIELSHIAGQTEPWLFVLARNPALGVGARSRRRGRGARRDRSE